MAGCGVSAPAVDVHHPPAWMFDADGELMKPELDLYHDLRLTDAQWDHWFDCWDALANARQSGRNGVKLIGGTGDPEQPRWIEVVDALIELGRLDHIPRDAALRSEWIKYVGCPGCGSSGAFVRRDKATSGTKTYDKGQVRVSCGRRCKTSDVYTQLGFETVPKPHIIEWEGGPQDEEAVAMNAAAEFARAVEREAYYLRVKEAARDKVDAEKNAGVDFDALYLDREGLRDLPEPDPLIDRILPRHSYAVLRGRDHSFKSFVAVDWACCLATGKAWQTHTAEQVRVLYIVGEGAYGIAKRIDAWEYAWRAKVDREWLTIRTAALDMYRPGAAFDDLLQRVETGGYGLVIVDTLRRVSGRADGNGSDMGAVVDNIDQVKQATTDGSILVITHTGKTDTDSRGFSGIEDDADVIWHAKRDEQNLDLELTKMKDGPAGTTLKLQAEQTLDSLIIVGGTAAEANTTDSEAKILETLRDLFPDGVAGGKLLAATGLAETTYYRALRALRDDGRVVNTGTKQRPFYELPEVGVAT